MRKHTEPDPSVRSRFTIGCNRNGRWLVCDRLGLVGGIFVDKASAIRFVRTESGERPNQGCWIVGKQKLDMSDVFNFVSLVRYTSSAARSLKV